MKKDLTGQRFGRLTVIREADEPYRSPTGVPTRRWVCKCDCGNEVTVLQNRLIERNGGPSCGCLQREAVMALAHDLTGKRFGRLVVLERVPLKKKRSNGVITAWRCKCDCGKETTVVAKYLVSGEVRSCGCLKDDFSSSHISKSGDNALKLYAGTMVSKLETEKTTKKSKTGIRGVYWNNREQQYIACITVKGKKISRRCGNSLERAIQARKELHDEFAKPIIEDFYKGGSDNEENH